MPDLLHDQLQMSLGGAYTLERELGGGGMSRVFVAEDVALGRKVVVKVLAPELAAGVSAERFAREVRLVARLQHPHIVPVLMAGTTIDGLPFYTMPFVDGESLRDRLVRAGELPIVEAVAVLRDVSRALAYAHARGVVHRDIKPENVLFSGDAVVVADFGIAKALDISRTSVPGTTLTEAGTSLGTPAYMAPEQAAADPATDHRADLYALGCVGYELLAGQTPFTGRSAQQLMAAHATLRPVPVAEHRPSTPPALAQLTAQLLEKRPADRPQTAEEVLRRLDSVATTPTALHVAHAPAKAPPRDRSFRVRWFPLATALAVGCAAGVIGIHYMSRRSASVAAVTPKTLRLTYSGNVGCAAISPDGQQWASVIGTYSDDSDCEGRLILQPVPAGRATTLLDQVHRFIGPRWSPSGTRLMFAADLEGGRRGVFTLATAGGSPRLLDSLSGVFGFRDEHTAFVLAGRTVRFVDIESGVARDSALLPAGWQVTFIAWAAPGGPVALGAARGGRRYLVLTDERLRITDSLPAHPERPSWLGRGQLAYFEGVAYAAGDLMLQHVNVSTGRFDGPPTRLSSDLPATREISGDASGARAMVVRLQVTDVLHVAQLDGRTIVARALVRSLGRYLGDPVISPNGERVAYGRADALGFNTYAIPFGGGEESVVTADSAKQTLANWLGNSRLLLEQSETVPPAVTDLETGRIRRLGHAIDGLLFGGTLADGEWVWHEEGRADLLLSDSTGGALRRLPLLQEAGTVGAAIVTPDGQRVVVATSRGAALDGFLYGWTLQTKRWERIAALGPADFLNIIGVSNRDAYYATGGEQTEIWRMPLAGGTPVRHALLPFHCYLFSVSITPDGSRMVCNVTTYDPDVWLLDLKTPAS